MERKTNERRNDREGNAIKEERSLLGIEQLKSLCYHVGAGALWNARG